MTQQLEADLAYFAPDKYLEQYGLLSSIGSGVKQAIGAGAGAIAGGAQKVADWAGDSSRSSPSQKSATVGAPQPAPKLSPAIQSVTTKPVTPTVPKPAAAPAPAPAAIQKPAPPNSTAVVSPKKQWINPEDKGTSGRSIREEGRDYVSKLGEYGELARGAMTALHAVSPKAFKAAHDAHVGQLRQSPGGDLHDPSMYDATPMNIQDFARRTFRYANHAKGHAVPGDEQRLGELEDARKKLTSAAGYEEFSPRVGDSIHDESWGGQSGLHISKTHPSGGNYITKVNGPGLRDPQTGRVLESPDVEAMNP